MRGNKVLNHFIFVFLPIDDNLNFDISFHKRKTQ